MKTSSLWIAVIVVAIIAVGGYIYPQVTNRVGSINTNFTNIGVTGLSVGSTCGDNYTSCNGTAISKILTGTCNLIGGSSDTIAASGKKSAYCAVAGVVAGDKVFANLATSTDPNVGSVVVLGSSASSTSGYIEVTLLNASTTATQVTRFGTSTQYLIIR